MGFAGLGLELTRYVPFTECPCLITALSSISIADIVGSAAKALVATLHKKANNRPHHLDDIDRH